MVESSLFVRTGGKQVARDRLNRVPFGWKPALVVAAARTSSASFRRVGWSLGAGRESPGPGGEPVYPVCLKRVLYQRFVRIISGVAREPTTGDCRMRIPRWEMLDALVTRILFF
jgi:hypothetical protein